MTKRLINFSLAWEIFTHENGTTKKALSLSTVSDGQIIFAFRLLTSEEALQLQRVAQRAQILLEMEEHFVSVNKQIPAPADIYWEKGHD